MTKSLVSLSKPYVFLIIGLFIIISGTGFWLLQNGYFEKSDAPLEPWYALANENGDPLLGVFEGRIPCAIDNLKCTKVKVGLALYQNQETKIPTTYKLVRVYVSTGPGDRVENNGNWTVGHGIEEYPQAVVYELDSNTPEDFRSYWLVNETILLPLDQSMNPKVGNASWGYMLSRTH